MSTTAEYYGDQIRYDSILIPDLKVDVANAITEIIFKRRQTKMRKEIPKVEFWRKEYKEHESYKAFANDYIAELTQVKKILKIFSPEVVLKYAKEQDLWSLRYITKERLPGIIFDLFLAQIAYIKDLEIKASEIETLTSKVEYINNQVIRRNNKIGKGL